MSIESETRSDPIKIESGNERPTDEQPAVTGADSPTVDPTLAAPSEIIEPTQSESSPEPTPESMDQSPAAQTPAPPEDSTPPIDQPPPPAPPSAGDGDEEESEEETDEPLYRPGMNWFVLRVASNKENYVRDTLLRKVQIEGLESMVGRILVPTEKTKSLKGGKQRVTETKKYPGYVFVEMQLEPDGRIPQDVFFLIKETTGVGDFVGATGRPTPLSTTEVEQMLHDSRAPEEAPNIKMDFVRGDVVRITSGAFENYEGTVDEFFPDKGIVRVLVTIFGRQAPIDVEYWTLVRADE